MSQFRDVEYMSRDEIDQERTRLITRLIALTRQNGFMPHAREEASKEECLGMVLARACEWDPISILAAAEAALEDANWSNEALELELIRKRIEEAE